MMTRSRSRLTGARGFAQIDMADFPEDIAADILSRLPVKPLLRFRCVSKPWRALIDSPDFITSHLKRSAETRINRSLIIDSSYGLYSLDFCSLEVSEIDHHPPVRRRGRPPYEIKVVGSCNGLLLLTQRPYGIKGYTITVWNPFTRKYQILPSLSFESSIFSSPTHTGLGHDSVSDDYKVVVIQGLLENLHSEVQVCCLKSNRWRRIRNLPHFLEYDIDIGVFAGGALHWVANPRHGFKNVGCVVAAFDIANEKHRLVPLPDRGGQRYMRVGALEGCLCLCYPSSNQDRVDVWVMKEYGVRESWSKQFSLPCGSLRLLDYSTNGEEVVVSQDFQLCLVDLEHSLVKRMEVRGFPDEVVSEVCCVQSLVVPTITGTNLAEKSGTGRSTRRKRSNKHQ